MGKKKSVNIAIIIFVSLFLIFSSISFFKQSARMTGLAIYTSQPNSTTGKDVIALGISRAGFSGSGWGTGGIVITGAASVMPIDGLGACAGAPSFLTTFKLTVPWAEFDKAKTFPSPSSSALIKLKVITKTLRKMCKIKNMAIKLFETLFIF